MTYRTRSHGPVRWLVLVLVWAGWCWFFVRGKHCWLAGLGWLKPTSEQAVSPRNAEECRWFFLSYRQQFQTCFTQQFQAIYLVEV